MKTQSSTRTFLRLLAMAVLAAALSAGTSSAQDFHGTFTLPLEARWGKVILQPGGYTLALTRFRGGQREVIVRAKAQGSPATMILIEGQNTSPSLSKDDLVCVREGGRLDVRALEIAPLGETIYFAMPKGAHIYAQTRGDKRALLAMAPQLTQRVPVEHAAR